MKKGGVIVFRRPPTQKKNLIVAVASVCKVLERLAGGGRRAWVACVVVSAVLDQGGGV